MGKVVDARSENSYYAGRGAFIKDGLNYHLVFCTSGKPFVHTEGPQWEPDGRQWGVDIIRYMRFQSNNWALQEGNSIPIIEPRMEVGSINGTPEMGIENWRQKQTESGCTSSLVEFNDQYFLFFENFYFYCDDCRGNSADEIVGIFVARTKNGAKPAPGVAWEVLCIDDNWYDVTSTSAPEWKPIVKPLLARIQHTDVGGTTTFWDDHYTQYTSFKYWGAGVPSAVVKDNKIYLYYWDGSLKHSIMWEHFMDGLSIVPSGNYNGELIPQDQSDWENDAFTSYEVEEVRISFSANDTLTFSGHNEPLEVSGSGDQAEQAQDLVNNGEWKLQRVKVLNGNNFEKYATFYVKESGSNSDIYYKTSADGLEWENEAKIATLNGVKRWDIFRDPDEYLMLQSNWKGEVNLNESIVFLYARAWEYLHDNANSNNTYSPLQENFIHPAPNAVPNYYRRGFDIYGFGAQISNGTATDLTSITPAEDEDSYNFNDLIVDSTRRSNEWYWIHVPGATLAKLDGVIVKKYERGADAIITKVGANEFIPYSLIWGPDLDPWYTLYFGNTGGDAWMESSPNNRWMTAFLNQDTTQNARTTAVSIPGPYDEQGQGGLEYNHRPVSVTSIIPWVDPTNPTASSTGVYFVGLFDPKCYDGKETSITLHWTDNGNPADQEKTKYSLVDITDVPSDYWDEPFLHTFIDSSTRLRVFYINLPGSALGNDPDQDRFRYEGWSCVAEIVDGNNGTKDMIIVPLEANGL
jgi:hypothetical protein